MAKATETKTEKLEREYIIPLRRRYQHVPRYKRTSKAIKTIREFLVKHMKIYDRDLSKIKLDKYLNEAVWRRGIKNPPHKIKVKAIKDSEGIVRVELVDFPNKLKYKKLREEKSEKAAQEVIKKKKVEEKPAEIEKPVEQTDEKKEEEKEKKAATVEAGKELEKAAATQIKHQKELKQRRMKHQHRKAMVK